VTQTEIRLTGKVTLMIALVSIAVNLAVAFTTVRLYTTQMMAQVADHEARLRAVEFCISTDIAEIKTNLTWVVRALERMERRETTIP
jgi:hypothetical protein